MLHGNIRSRILDSGDDRAGERAGARIEYAAGKLLLNLGLKLGRERVRFVR